MKPPPRRTAVAFAALALALAGLGACTERATTHHKPGTDHAVASGPAGTLLATKDAAGHRFREVAAEGAPTVELTVRADSEDGWNLRLAVGNFHFTPDSAGGGALPGTGHAHLLLDGKKIARVYGAWHHLPAALVPPGAHTLTARLHADDHTVWAVEGEPVESAVPLNAGPDGDGHAHDHDGDGEGEGEGDGEDGGPARPAADRTVRITVADGAVEPPPGRIELKKGDRIELRVESDRDDTLHVHGFDREAELPAGELTTCSFVADRTGLFEVETHGAGLVLTQLVVR